MIAKELWQITNVGQAKQLQHQGYMVYYRPDSKLNPFDPDNDLAWYCIGE